MFHPSPRLLVCTTRSIKHIPTLYKTIGCICRKSLHVATKSQTKNSAYLQQIVENSHSDYNTEHGNHNDGSHCVNSVKSSILDQALLHVTELGWSEKAIAAGAKGCGYSSSASGMFPRKGADLALHFYQSSNRSLFDSLQAEVQERALRDDDTPKPSVQAFIRDAVDRRIRMTAVYQSTWPQAMGLMTHPSAAGDALTNLGQLVDDIWYLAGDKSHDMSWYAKRAELAFIYKTAELFMLQDKSEDFTETSKFIQRRFEDLGVVVSTLSLSKDFTAGFLNGGMQSMWTIAKNMAGVYPR